MICIVLEVCKLFFLIYNLALNTELDYKTEIYLLKDSDNCHFRKYPSIIYVCVHIIYFNKLQTIFLKKDHHGIF